MKFLKNKIFIFLTTIILCGAISFAVLAEAVPTADVDVTLKVEYNNIIQDEFVGIGTNSWINLLSNESKEEFGVTQAHFDLNSKRIATIPASNVRFMFMPHYVMFLDDADKGKAKWFAGEINTDNDLLKGFVEQCRVYQENNIRVMFNWGGAVDESVLDWWGIDDIFDPHGGSRSGPDDLKQYAEMMAITLSYLRNDLGLTNIDIVNYHNEINHTNFAVFGDKRVAWVEWLELAHNALVNYDLRDKVTVLGVDNSDRHGFEGDWGMDSTKAEANHWFKYVYDNARDYYDYLSLHMYNTYNNYTHTIDSRNNTNIANKGILQYCTDVIKWYPDTWLTEFAGPQEDLSGTDEQYKNWAIENAFEISRAGQALAHINTGFMGNNQWGYFGGWIPSPISNFQAAKNNETNPAYIIYWNCVSDNNGENESDGVNAVNPSIGEMGILHRYVPKTNAQLGTLAQTLKTTSSSEDVRFAALTQQTKDASNNITREDVTYIVETNDGSNKNFNINVDSKYQGLTFKKYLFEYPEKFMDGTTGTQFDANAVLIPGENVTVTDGKIVDSVDSKHYLIVYTTIDEAQQVYFSNVNDVEQHIEAGASHSYSQILTEGLDGLNVNFEYSIKTGSQYAQIDQNGNLTINSNAPAGEWISVKVTAKGTGVKETEAYTIGLVKVK